MKQKQSVREHQFDNIKALLIFLVVLGHVLKNFGTTTEADILYKIIFSFHMPAFIFVSGYFAKCDPKRILSRMFPLYIVFQCVRFLLDCILKSAAAGAFVPVDVQFFTPRWTLWYLFAMIVYQLLLPVFDTPNRRHRIAYLVLAVSLGMAAGLNKDTGNFMAMSRILSFLPFFLLGYYEKSDHLLMTFGKRKCPGISRLLSGVLAAVLLVVFAAENRYIKARWFYGTESFDGGGICMVYAFAGMGGCTCVDLDFSGLGAGAGNSVYRKNGNEYTGGLSASFAGDFDSGGSRAS